MSSQVKSSQVKVLSRAVVLLFMYGCLLFMYRLDLTRRRILAEYD